MTRISFFITVSTILCHKYSLWNIYQGVANGTRKNHGLGNLSSNLEFSNTSQKTSKCGKNISDTLGYTSCATFCSYHILMSYVIYYWTDTRQHGIYLLNSWRLATGWLLLVQMRTIIHVSSEQATGTGYRYNLIIFIYSSVRISCSSYFAANSFQNQLEFSQNEVSGSDFVKTFKSRSQIFKQRSWRLGKSQILPFATLISP